MSRNKPKCPASRSRLVDLYFMEHRAKLIDIAAFLDRLDRAGDGGEASPDFRVEAFRRALALLTDGEPRRARRVLELFSDHSTEPVGSPEVKSAYGACPP